MSYHFDYSIEEIESMLPYERDIFVDFTLEDLRKKKEENEKRQNSR